MLRQTSFNAAHIESQHGEALFASLARPLTEPELDQARKVEGFPAGEESTIQSMCVPPFYTACPNPFLPAILAEWERQRVGHKEVHELPERREPFAADITEGKQDPIYKVHPYHTKVPPRAIVRYLLHYTRPGDIVLDAFCGSGMTGVAAQLCGAADPAFRAEVEAEWMAAGTGSPGWGPRYAILSDLSPSATAIAANYNLPVDASAFAKAATELLEDCRSTASRFYTPHPDVAGFRYAIWSQVFACPECGARLRFMDLAFDLKTRQVYEAFHCPQCGSELKKDALERTFVSQHDPIRGGIHRQIAYELSIIARGESRRIKLEPAGPDDRALAENIADIPIPENSPVVRFPLEKMVHGSRLGPKGVEYLHDLYFRRQLFTLAELWQRSGQASDPRLRSALRFWIDQAFGLASKLARFPQLSPLNGVYYLPSMVVEHEPVSLLEGRLEKVRNYFSAGISRYGQVVVSTNSAASLPGLPDNSIDYIFTDPPFGENIPYADLNFVVEAWYGVLTAVQAETTVDKFKNKDLKTYHEGMVGAFREFFRVLRPDHWMTVVFHNSSNAVWNTIHAAMLEAGFIVADVRTMDKQQRSFRQVTSSAVKQDLVISAYKPDGVLDARLRQVPTTEASAWEFVMGHLKHLPVFNSRDGEVEILRERQAHVLYNRMVAAHVQRGAGIPVSMAEFIRGLFARFIERDGMFFLEEQAALYDQERARVSKVEQLALFISDEKSAIQWLQRELDADTGSGPQTYSDLQPRFLRELQQARFEFLPELRDLLRENFLQDEDERWFVPDPNRQADLEAMRLRGLLREFNQYLRGRGVLKLFRSEAIRAGFSQAWQQRDYETILNVARRIPENILQEDPQMLMYVHNASLRATAKPRQMELVL